MRFIPGRFFFLLTFIPFVFLSQKLSAQSTLASSPVYQTLDQQTIRLIFFPDLAGSTTTGQWFIRIDPDGTGPSLPVLVTTVGISGSPTGPFTPSFSPTSFQLNIRFDATLANGPGIPYIKPGQTMTIQFVNSGNTLLTTGTLAPVLGFGPTTAVNNYVPPGGAGATGSVDMRPVSEGPLIGTDQCSPVNTNFYRWTYAYSLRFFNSSNFVAADQRINVAWNGPPGTTSVVAGYRSDNGGAVSSTFTDPTLVPVLGPVALMTFCAGLNPTTQVRDNSNGQFSYNDNTNICNFRATGFPSGLTVAAPYNGNGIPVLQIAHQFDSYDFDDGNTGTLNLNPVVPPASLTTTSDQVCLGVNLGSRFTDVSTFNCIGNGTVLPVPSQGAVNNPINNQQRWIRFIYGSIDSPTPQSNIRDARVNGVQVIDNNPGAPGPGVGKLVNGPVGQAPLSANPMLISTLSPTTRGFVVTGAGGPGIPNVPDANGVIELPSAPPSVASNTLSSLITTLSTTNHAVGQRFYVTIQYWNVCNPYPASAPVETTVDFVEIIQKPAALTTLGAAICFTTPNSTAFNFTANSLIAAPTRTAVNWYKDLASVGTVTKMVNPTAPAGNALSFPAGSYGGQGGIGGAFTSNNANGRYHSVWATQVTGGTNACESDPVEIVIVQQPRIDIAPDIPSAPSGSTVVCNGGAAEAYSTSAPNTKTIAINTSTNLMGPISLPTENFWSLNNFSVATVSLSATTGNSVNATYAISPEPNPLDNGEVRVRRRYVTTTNIPVVSPLLAPYTLPTYNINPLICQNANVNLSVDVFGQSDGGTISPSPTICNGSSTGNMTVTGTRGAILQWERQLGAGAFVAIAGTAGSTTFSEVPPSAGTFHYRVLVQNQNAGGPCASATTIVGNQNTVTVNVVPPKPTITPSGVTTFCFGGSVMLTSSTVSAARYDWYRGVTLIQSSAVDNIVLTTVAQSGSYTVQTFGIAPSNCPSIASDPTVVTINALPTASNPSGGGSVCSGVPAPDITWILTGAAPFNFTISRSVEGPLVVVGHNSTTYTIVAPNPSSSQTYQITSLMDANTCVATSMGGTATVNVTLTPPPSVETFTATAAVCNDAGLTDPPDAILNLLPNSVQNYDITYTVNGVPFTELNKPSDGSGVLTLSPPYTAWGSVPGSYAVIVTALKNTVTLCAGAVPFSSAPLVVNARPVVPTGAITNVACSTGGGVPLSVNDPGVGFEVEWSTAGPALASFAAAFPGSGAESGTRNLTFTPTSSATATFFAFTRNTITNCFSTTGLAVTQTQDTKPASAAAGADQPLLCVTTTTLAATAATAGGSGSWSAPSAIAYQQNFESPVAVGTTNSNAANGWTRTVSGANAFPQQTPGGYFEVRSGQRFEAENTNGNLGGGAGNIGEVVWQTPVISLVGFATVDASVLVDNVSNNLNAGADNDYVKVFFKLNGAAETIFPTNGNLTGNFVDATAFATGLAGGGTLQIVIRVSTNASGEIVAFDNVLVKTPTSTISFSNPNLFNSTVSGLPQNAPGGAAIATTLTWTVASALGSCPTSQDDMIATVNALPTALTITPQLCDDVTGAPFNAAGISLSTYSASVSSAPTVDWYASSADRIAGTPKITTPITVTNGQIFFFRATSAIPCTNDGQTTFTVNALPAALDKAYAFCEDAVNGGIATGINLTSFEMGAAGVTNGGTGANRDVEWYEDNAGALGALIPIGAAAGQESNYQITVTKTVHAKVIDLTSPVIPRCFDIADVVLTYKPKPVNNPLTGDGTVCTGSTIRVYQVNSATNNYGTVHNYNWNLSGGGVSFEVFNGVGFISSTNYTVTNTAFLLLVRYPNPGSFTVTVSETIDGCTGNTNSFGTVVSGAPIALAFASPATQVCKGATQSYSLTSANGGSQYNWTVIGGTIIGSSTTIGSATINVIWGTSTLPQPNVSVTETNVSGCPGTPASIDITLNDVPQMASVNNTAICSGAAPSSNLPFLSTIAGSTFSWKIVTTTANVTFTGGAAIPTFPSGGSTGTGNVNHLLFNTSGVIGTIVYEVTPTETNAPSPPDCSGNPQTITVTVNPEPVVNAVSNISVCSGDPVPGVTFSANTSGGEVFNWSNNNITIGLGTSGSSNISGYTAPTNFTGLDIVGTITVTATKNGCTSAGANLKTFTITIKPQPVVNGIANITVCSGGTITIPAFTANTGGGETFNWTSTNTAVGLIASGTGSIAAFTAAANVTGANVISTVTVSASKNGCTSVGGNSKSFTITVQPAPVVAAVTNIIVCPGDMIGPIAFTANTGGGETFNWTNSDIAIGLVASGSGNIASYVAPANNTGSNVVATISVAATATTTCVGSATTFTITIKPQPVVTAITNVSVCSGDPIAAINFAANTGGGETFNWSNTNTAIGLVASGSGGIAAYTAPINFTGVDIVGTITVSATKNSCISIGANTKTFTITIKPQPVVNAVTNVSVCSGDPIAAIPFSANTGGGETFNWSNNNISVGLAATGIGNIAAFTAPNNFTGVDIVATLTITATKNSCLSVGANIKTFTITVKPQPVVAVVPNVSVCSGDAITAINFSANTGGSETFNWANTNTAVGLAASGSGSIAAYTAPNNFTGVDMMSTVTVTAIKNSCTSSGSNSKSFTITIKPQPVVVVIANVSVCSGDAVPAINFTANTGGGETFNWTNSNPAVGLSANGTGSIGSYTAPNNFTGSDIVATITVLATKNSCVSAGANSKTFTITIRPQPVVTTITNISVCSGDLVSSINFTANTGGGETFNWTNTDAAVGIALSGSGSIASYTAPNNFTGADIVSTITVTATKNSCISAGANIKSFTITIKPQPVVTAISNISVCSGDLISVPAFVANTGGSETFNWSNNNTSIGIGSTGTGNISSYTAPNNFTGADIIGTITVTATKNGCTSAGANSKTFTITIKPQPVVSAITNVSVCSGASISAINFTANTGGSEVFNWTNTNTAIGIAASGSGGIGAYVAPINITGSDIVGTVTVTATKNSCTSSGTNSKTFTITIKAEPVVTTVTDISVCSGSAISAINFTANTSGGETFNWTNTNTAIGIAASGAGAIGSYTAPTNFTGADIVGIITVTATKSGCTSTGANREIFTITIKPEPVVVAITDVSVCSGTAIGAIPFTANTAGGETFNWTNSNPAIGLTVSGTGSIASYTAPVNLSGSSIVGSITVTATKNGCTSAGVNLKTFTITIKPEPVVNSIPNVSVCSGDAITAVNFAANTGGGEVFNWTNTNAAIGQALSGSGNIAAYTAPNNFTGADIVGTLTVSATKDGCISVGVNAKSFTITIKPQPVVDPVAVISVCSGDVIPSTVFTANTGGSETFNWSNNNTSIGISSTGTGNIASYTAPNNFTGSDMVGTITVTATKNSCTSAGANSKTFTITIKPQPVVTAVTNISVCSGGAISTINFTANTGGSEVFNWTNTNTAIGLVASGSGNIIGYTAPNNFTGLDIVSTITITAAKNGCTSTGSNSKTFTITIKPQPVVAAITNIAVCSGDAISAIAFSANSGGGEIFNWANGNTGIGLAASGSGNIASYTAPTNTSLVDIVATITVSATKNSCTSTGGNSKSFTITVHPEPQAPALTTIDRCSGQSINFDLQSIINGVGGNSLPSKFTYTITSAAPSGNDLSPAVFPGMFDRLVSSTALITETFSNFTNHDVTLTYNVVPFSQADNCDGVPFTFKVVIHPEPVGQDFTDPLCATTLNHNIQTQITNGVTSKFTYTVASDNGGVSPATNRVAASSVAITDIYTNTTGVVANITYTITAISTANNCTGALTFNYVVQIFPTPVGTNTPIGSICSDVAFTVNPQVGITNGVIITKYDWTANYNGLTVGGSTPPSGQTNATGNISASLTNLGAVPVSVIYTITPYSGSCPGSTYTLTKTIDPEPVVATNLNETKCSGDVYGKLLNTNGTSVGASTYDVTVVSKDAGLTGGRPLGLIGGGGSTNNVLINDSYTNVTATALKVVYSVVPQGTNACGGDAKLVEFIINPEPVLSVPAPPTICSSNLPNNPSTTGIVLGTNGTSVNANTYRIDQILYNGVVAAPAGFTFPVTNKLVGSSGGINHIQGDIFTNTSLLPVTVRYNITPISLALCEGADVNIDIVVNPEPKLDPALSPTPICSGDKIDPLGTAFELRSQPAVSVASASFILRGISFPGLTAGASNESTGGGKLSNALDDDSYVNITTGPLIATYMIAPVSAAGCIGPDQTIDITVNPAPAMKSGLDRIVCNEAVSNIVLQDNSPTTIVAVSYDIISVTVPVGLTPDGGNASVGLTTNVNRIKNDKFVNNTTDRIIVTYQVVPVSVAGCRGPQAAITLTVEPQIISATVNTTTNICSGSPINLTFASPTYANGNATNPIVTFSYTMVSVTGISGNTLGNNLAEGTVITDVLVNTTNASITVNYKVTPRASSASNGVGCTGDVENVFIIVQPRPKITAINNKTVCENDPINLNLVSTTIPSTGSIKFFVTAVASSGNVTGFTNGSFLSNNTVLADALANSGSVTESVTYTIEPRNVDGANATICAGPSIDVIVTVSPRPIITPIANFAICSGEPFNPIPIVTDTENAIPGSTLVTWTVTPDATVTGESNGAGNSFSQVLFNNSNDKKTVTYTINAKNITNSPSCSGTALTLNVTVYPVPKIVSLPSSVNVCNNGTLSPTPYVLTSSVVASLNPVFDWIVDDGTNPDLADLPAVTNATAINQTFVNTGSFLGTYQYTITPHLTIPVSANPIVGNTCTGQDGIMVVNVAPPVSGEIYGFDITGTKSTNLFLCKGAKEFLYIDPVGLPLMEVTYKEGSITKVLTKLGGLNILQVSPTVTTVYELISVKDKFGCVKNINQIVTVNVDAVSNEFSIVGPTISCSPFKVQFKHDQVAGVNYTWKWLDGPDSTTYQAATTVAGKIITHTFVNPSPSTQSKFKVSLEAFLDTTKYQLGCKKLPFVKEIKVYPTISTGVFPDNTVLCSGETVKFVNTSQGVSTAGHKWFYRVQGSSQEIDIKTTANISYTLINTSASNPIIFEVVYKSTNGNCPAEDVVTPITVYRGATAGFNEGTVPPYIGGHSIVTFTNTTVPVDAIDFKYEWEFGSDGNPPSANGVGPFTVDYTTPGDKDVILTVTNIGAETDGRSCVSEFRKTINILLLPLVANFKASPQAACFPSDISVTENTATGDVMEWKVVDSNGRVAATSNANLPVFQITNPGTYSIFLKTTSSFTGQVANTQQDNFEIYPLPVASFDARPSLLFVPDTELNVFNFSTGATDYLWDFGDNGTSTEEEPKYTYKIEGVYDLTLIAMNDHGDGIVCSDTLVRKITAKQGGVTKVPNAFTPNLNGPNGGVSGNGSFNDVFLPYVKGAEEFSMQIFDRWGNLVFESNNSTIGWDGYDRYGRLMASGVYVYRLTLRLSDGQRTTQIGDITMIR